MVRPSNRARIIEAAIRTAGRDGLRGVTIDAVASEANLTKGGVQYHFHTKEDLMSAIVDHIIETCERAALKYLVVPFDQATHTMKLEAYLRASTSDAIGGGELAVFFDGTEDKAMGRAWAAYQQRWTAGEDSQLTDAQRLAIFAADGLWMNDMSASMDMSAAERERIVSMILALVHVDEVR